MGKFVGYRAGRVAGGGMLNGYGTPRAQQTWEIGQVVNVGFVKGLVVKAKTRDGWALWQPSTNRWYHNQPHMGLTRCETAQEAMA